MYIQNDEPHLKRNENRKWFRPKVCRSLRKPRTYFKGPREAWLFPLYTRTLRKDQGRFMIVENERMDITQQRKLKLAPLSYKPQPKRRGKIIAEEMQRI